MPFSSYTRFRPCNLLVFSKRLSCLQSWKTTGLKMYTTVERGALYTEDYRMYFKSDNVPISPVHDIPLLADSKRGLYNMVVEIPRWTNAKMEMNMREPLNPIKQDVKKGKVRFVSNFFPHHGYIWNYGAFPQTWENPSHIEESTGCKGDNDPIDVIEIGSKVAHCGQLLQVKILGCIALVDEGETDWKILAIDNADPCAGQVNDLQDIEKVFPGLLKATVEWFRIYKIPDGKPENKFAFNGEPRNRDFAIAVVDKVHGHWKAIVTNQVDRGEISCSNLTIEGSPYKIEANDAKEVVKKTPEPKPAVPIDQSVHKWHYIRLCQ